MRWLELVKLLPRVSEAVAGLQVKGWYLSKTIWVNLLTMVAGIAYAVTGNEALTLSEDELAALSVAGVAAGNIVLRILTSKPIGLRSLPSAAGRGSGGAVSPADDNGV